MEITQNVGDILDRVKIAYGIKTDAGLARFLEISVSTPSNWRSRDSLDFKLIFTKCRDLNFNWLIKGEGEPRIEEKNEQPVLAEAPGIYPINGSRVDNEDLTIVPVYSDVLSAGAGADAASAEIVGTMGFMTTWLRQEARIDPSRAFVAMVRGDSMIDVLFDGDLVLGERVSEIDHHGIFVLRRWNDIHVKHVQKDGRYVRLISHNPIYPPIELEAPSEEELTIVGRVVRRIVRI